MADKNQTALSLRDIHLPEPISWWPPAPGWWILLSLLLLAIAGFFLFRQLQKKQALKKQILVRFDNICQQYNKEKNSIELVQSLSILLRRACISFYPRSDVASLTGDDWLQFLDRTGQEKLFNTEHGKLIASAPYLSKNSTINSDTNQLILLCKTWLNVQPNKKYQSTSSSS